MSRVYHAWSERPRNGSTARRHAIARESWERGGDLRVGVPVPDADLERDAREVGEARPLPFVRDLVDRAAALADPGDILAVSNDDVCVAGWVWDRLVGRLPEYGAAYAHRWDFPRVRKVMDDDRIRNGRWYSGLDFFAFTREWWMEHRLDFPDMVIGRPWWDWAYRWIIHASGGADILTAVYHEKHAREWRTRTGTRGKDHNRKFLDDMVARFGQEFRKPQDKVPGPRRISRNDEGGAGREPAADDTMKGNPQLMKWAPATRAAPPPGYSFVPPPVRVVMAYHKGDAECFMRLLRWMDDLHGPSPNPALVVADTGGPEDLHAAVMEMARKVFPSAGDFRIAPPPPGSRWPETNNHVFYGTARFLASHPDPRPWLWMESDMVPLRPDWIAAIDEAYAKAARPFMGNWVECYDIMNGSGVYPPDLPSWIQRTAGTRRMAFDCALAPEMVRFLYPANHLFPSVFLTKANGRPAVAHGSGPEWTPELADFILTPDAAVVHRCKTGALIGILREKRGLPAA